MRVLVAELPAMLRDVVVRLIEAEDDMEVVVPNDEEVLTGQVAQHRPDAVVLGLRDSELSPLGTDILDQEGHLKILGITPDGRRAVLYQLRPQACPLGEVSPEALVQALRGTYRGDRFGRDEMDTDRRD